MLASRSSFAVVQGLTLSRIPLAVIFAAVMEQTGGSGARIAMGLGVLLLSELSDLFDGILARRWGVASDLGSLIDPYADSLSRLLVYWALARAGTAWGLLPLVMAWRDVTVAYCRMILVRSGKTAAAGLSGKIKAWVQALGAFVLLLALLLEGQDRSVAVSAVCAVVLLVTVWSAVDYIRDAVKALPSAQ